MALRVSSTCELKISQDNAANPQELTFSSGSKNLTDSISYNESAAVTFQIPAGAVDTEIDLGSLALSEIMFLMAKGPDLTIKLVPQGEVLADTLAYTLLPNAPAILPFKIVAVHVSNSNAAAQILILGAAGN